MDQLALCFCRLALTRGRGIRISCVLGHQVVFQIGRAAMIAQITTTKHTDHFGLVNGTIWQLFKSKLIIQNLIGINFGVLRSPSTQNVTLAYYFLAGSQAQTSVWRACCFVSGLARAGVVL